jgi:F1F0 ATPase subunit 2
MSSVALWALIFIGGFLLGLLYFWLLWLTVCRLFVTMRPFRLMIVSFAVRSGMALGGFYLLMDGSWGLLLAALGGFIVARELGKRLWGKRDGKARIPAMVGGIQ